MNYGSHIASRLYGQRVPLVRTVTRMIKCIGRAGFTFTTTISLYFINRGREKLSLGQQMHLVLDIAMWHKFCAGSPGSCFWFLILQNIPLYGPHRYQAESVILE